MTVSFAGSVNWRPVFAGIDVAYAQGKRLPVVLAGWEEGRLVPLPLRQARVVPSGGQGIVAALEDRQVEAFAVATVAYFQALELEFKVRIRRVAIDSPSHPKEPHQLRRRCEAALTARGIRYLVTPSAAELAAMIQKAKNHLAAGGTPNQLPHLNQLWMRVGFALFRWLRQQWDCLEVYPHALWLSLGVAVRKKSRPAGLRQRLAVLAHHTGWPKPPELAALQPLGWGSYHDRLEAYAAAWLAALEEEQRQALGDPHQDDAIWLPLRS